MIEGALVAVASGAVDTSGTEVGESGVAVGVSAPHAARALAVPNETPNKVENFRKSRLEIVP
jgi:hypothetical protein